MRSAFTHILGSTALAQLLLLASTPILMRFYDQATFGVFGIASAIALTGSVLVSLRLDHSLHLSAEPEQLLGSALQVIFLLSLVALIPVIAHGVLSGTDHAAYIYLFATSHAVWTSTLMFLNLRHRYRLIACQNLLPVVIFLAGALGVPLLAGDNSAGATQPSMLDPLAGDNALLYWQALAYAVSALVGCWAVRRDIRFGPFKQLGRVLRAHRDDVRYLVPARLLSIVSANMTVFGSAWLFGPELTGLVVVANRISRAPVRVLGNGMNNVLRAAVARPESLFATFSRVGTIALVTALLAVTVVLLLPDALYVRLVGNDWGGLAPVLLIATVAAGFQLMAGSVTSLLDTYAKRANLQINIALFAGGAIAILTAALIDLSLLGYLWVGCTASAIVHATSFYLSYGVVRREQRQ